MSTLGVVLGIFIGFGVLFLIGAIWARIFKKIDSRWDQSEKKSRKNPGVIF